MDIEELRPELVSMARQVLADMVAREGGLSLRPATVTNADYARGVVSVRLDGDTEPVVVQALVGLPPTDARVIVLLVPPHGGFVIGAVNGNTLLPTGTVVPWAGAVTTLVPAGWLVCDGTLYKRNTYGSLFAVVGTLYGTTAADNFRVPDLRGRVVAGAYGYAAGVLPWSDWDAIGKVGGSPDEAITVGQLPAHSHPLITVWTNTVSHDHQGVNALSEGAAPNNGFAGGSDEVNTRNTGGGLGAGGAGAPHKMQPSVLLRHLIKA